MKMEEDVSAEKLFFLLKKISLTLTPQLEEHLKTGDMSGVQVYFLVYILRHHPNGTYLTELCREIGAVEINAVCADKETERKGIPLFSGRSGGSSEERKCSPQKDCWKREAHLSRRRIRWRRKSQCT